MRYAFDSYLLDPALRELRCGKDVVHCEPQLFDLIHYLLRHRDRVVSRDELLDCVWEGRFVSESTFRNRINAARRLVGDDGEAQRVIRTLPRRGFRFVAHVDEADCGGAAGEGLVTPEDPDYPPVATSVVSSTPREEDGRLDPSGKPVVAVLPFIELGGGGAHEHIADGISIDVITALARHRSFLVVARNTAFAFRGHAGDIRELGRQLGADYLVEGSVRITSDRLRVSAHLVDASTGAVIWADAFEEAPESLFEVQNSIIEAIVAAVEPQIGLAERVRIDRSPPKKL